jgi:hypothetical protein
MADLQAPGELFQFAYTTDDAHATALAWTATLGIGPWSVRGPFTATSGRYRGRMNEASLTVARTFNGGVMIELIQQHDEHASIFREAIQASGFGFHHVAIADHDFDKRAAVLQSAGGAPIFEDVLPTGARVAFFQGAPGFPALVELVELTPAQQAGYDSLHALCRGWDGTEPWRVA